MSEVRSRRRRREHLRSSLRIARSSSLALTIALALPGVAQAADTASATATSTPAADTSSAQPAASGNAAPAPATSSDTQIGDITVTARRVTERLQDIPASVAAVTGDNVGRMSSLADLQSMVSGVTFRTIGPVPLIGIRGFGNRSQAGNPSNSAVGIYQDGVFVAPTLSTIINRTDTDRVEVAKGPQSTLYGRSSFVGAINIVTADPGREQSVYVDVGYGMSATHGDDLWRVQVGASLPLSDTLSVRLYGLEEHRDGYVYDSTTGNRSGGYSRRIGRMKILWQPSDAVSVRLSASLMHDDVPFPFVTAGIVRAPLGQSVVFANPISPASRAALHFGSSVWDAQLVTPQHNRIDGEEATLDVRIRTPIGELASLTDFQHATLRPFFSLDLTRLNWANGSSPYLEQRYSQELRLSNNVGRFNYLFGLYYLHQNVSQGGGKVVNVNAPFATFGPGSTQYDLGNVNALFQPAYTATRAYAAFGQVGYDLTDRLNLTLGLRYGRDEISGTAGVAIRNRLANIIITTAPITFRSGTFDAVTGSANLSYKIAPDALVYASYGRGNSPGGFNTGAAARLNYGEQNVNAYEIGLRSRLLDRHLQLNLAAFDNEYSGLQLSQNVIIGAALTSIVSNAGKAHGRGFDVDAEAILSSNWHLGLQYTYVDSRITSYTIPAPPSPQVNLTGVPLVRSPKHSLNGSITFLQDIGPGRLQIRAEESYTSGYTNDYQGVPAGTAYPGITGVLPAGVTTTQVLGLYGVPGYALTNLNASYSWDRWRLSGSVRNLFNRQYIASVLAFDMVTVPIETPGPPRTFELSMRYSF
jgi:iron complex outermembrane receptor protein